MCPECRLKKRLGQDTVCRDLDQPVKIKPIVGPGTMLASEFYRTQHAPQDPGARALFDYCCPPPVVFDSQGCVSRVN